MLDMYSFLPIFGAYAALISGVSSVPLHATTHVASVPRNEQVSALQDNLVVDLGYEQYQGVSNATTGLNNWFGCAVGSSNRTLAAG